VIKPSDVGLSTNIVIHTDRRSYNIQLVSKKDQWMPLVSFSYPDDNQAQWAAYQEHQQFLNVKATIAPTATTADLNFNYRIHGDSTRWKPVNVYSIGGKTYIQFPANIKYEQIPALVILDRNQEQVVNYRMVADKYVVDQVIEKAALIRGVGKNQERVEISREGS
jgi:type IV secretion system protein VirB9